MCAPADVLLHVFFDEISAGAYGHTQLGYQQTKAFPPPLPIAEEKQYLYKTTSALCTRSSPEKRVTNPPGKPHRDEKGLDGMGQCYLY